MFAQVVPPGSTATAHPPSDPLHGGEGRGVRVIGHSDLGGQGLNGHVEVLKDHAYIGFGTNGGFASQWNKTPSCKDGGPAGSVKVVSLSDPTNPAVVSTISVSDPAAPAGTIARDVAALDVQALSPLNVFTGDLLAVALEACNAGDGFVGVNFYDVSNPANPVLVGRDDRFVGNVATRDVSLLQRPDGRVLALEANQGSLAGGIHVVDVTNPATPVTVGELPQSRFSSTSTQECRPFNFAQGATPNQAGSKAYVAYQDEGLLVLDTSNLAPGAESPVISQTRYPGDQEGNSFRFIPNQAETLALVTDEDLLPARTTLSIASGPAAGSYRGCEAIWGSPLYQRTTTSLSSDIVPVGGAPGETGSRGCATSDYAGVDAQGKIVLVYRGTCNFDFKALNAQAAGGIALLIANTVPDHHGGGTGVLFSVDAAEIGDAGVTIPLVMITQEAGNAISQAAQGGVVAGTLSDAADTWGALGIFSLSGGPSQIATFNAPHTTTLIPGQGLYHAVNALWVGDQAAVAWMSDGFRVVDVSVPSSPAGRAFYVPPAVPDPTAQSDPPGNYATVPLVVGVAEAGPNRFVITDINGGLYVLDVVLSKDDCKDDGWRRFGFANQGECVTLFDE